MRTTKSTLTVGLAIVCLALLGGWVATRSHAAADATTTKQAPDDKMQQLLSARLDCATKALRHERAKLDNGRSTFDAVFQAARRVLDAEVELSATSDGRKAALTKHVALMRQFERDAAKRVEQGTLPVGEDESPRYWRLTAEVELLRVQRAATATK